MAAIDLDDDLTIKESPWRGRIITLAIVVGIAAAIGAGLYFFYFKDDSTTLTRATEDLEVKRATINQTLIISGTADAEFNSNLIFQASGKVDKVNVKVGDAVKQGDVLASLESDDLANNLQSTRANLRLAQLKLEDLLDGASAAELAGADQAVAQAQSAVVKAKNDQKDMLDGATVAELAALEQAVAGAEAQLAGAESSREKLDNSPSAADLAAAEAGVAAARTGLTAAENSAASAQNGVIAAAAALTLDESTYCALDSAPAFCTTRVAPISGADAALMNTALISATPGVPGAAAGVIAGNASYLGAENSADSAAAAVDSAEDALTSAEKKLAAANDGPTSEDKAAADAAVTSAEAALNAAQKKLADVKDGATDLQRANAQTAIDSAEAALEAALAKRAEAVRGPDANQIAQAQQGAALAQLTVEAAQIRVKNAQIIAPFDGVVASINAKPGEFFAAASASGAAIVLLTPERLIMKMSVGETDYANIRPNQVGGVLFDSIPGKIYPFRISEIGLSPSITQGVVTYTVKASLVLPADAPRPSPGMNARGQIITDSKPDVLVVPPRAIRKSGNDQVVDVRRDGGVEEQIVTTGATDSAQVEILTGLNEGDVVVVASLTSTGRPGATPKPEPTLPGNVR